MNNRFYDELILLLITCLVALPLQFIPKLKENKKVKIIFCIMVIVVFGIYATYTSIKDNPKVDAKLGENYIEFKKNEVISLNNIEDVQFYDNVKFEIVANGYRWGNDDYYSGDANVNIKKGKKTLKYIYKGKVYINANNKSYIVLNEKGTTKFYVFNLGTKKKTKQMYYELLEHAH